MIFLIGMMGVGKTTVGRLLAERLGVAYCDSDAQVVANTGMTVPEIFAQHGEAAFRAEESKALRDAAAGGDAVVAVAGGAVLDPENRKLLRSSGTVVWLRARVETMASRVGQGAGRPLLAEEEPAAVLARLYPQREPLYAELADVVVDVDDATPQQIVEQIAAAL